ncbi:TPA: hypothetical protein JFW75_000978 [Salmonella enterica]|nr:hypothetical protein [Salmonella enterica]
MANLRDDFSSKIKEKLRARVGNKCSNPDCRVYTTGPGVEDKINNIGVAAHICAASPGGPRYDLNMTVKQRKSFDNGIWLCANCSIDIDRDIERYTVQLLYKWKKEAEDKSRGELGNKAAEPDDAINTVAMALSGYPKSVITQAIKNVHKATEISLEEKDPRFKVSSRFDGEQTIFTLVAKPEVCMTMHVSSIAAKNFNSNYKKLIETGETLCLNTQHITISGSPLIDELMSDKDGELFISTRKIEALAKLSLVDSSNGIIISLDDLSGAINHGTKQLVFKGSSYDDLLKIELVISLFEYKGKSKLSVDFSKWNGKEINRLPFFNKLQSLFDKICNGWNIDCNIEIEGESLFYGALSFKRPNVYIERINSLLNYISNVRIISRELSREIYFSNDCGFTREEYLKVKSAVSLLQGGKEFYAENITSNPCLTLSMNERIRHLFTHGGPFPECFRFDADADASLNLFGVNVILPRKYFEFKNIKFKTYQDISSIKDGEEVKIEIVPGVGFIGYEKFIR